MRSAVLPKSKRSGATYSSLMSPRMARASRSEICDDVSVLLTNVAGSPRAVSASTWSFISEMSGEMTTVSLGSISAGTWKQSDLPPPVGRTTSVSLAGEHRLNRCFLSRTKAWIAEALAQRSARVVERGCGVVMRSRCGAFARPTRIGIARDGSVRPRGRNARA